MSFTVPVRQTSQLNPSTSTISNATRRQTVPVRQTSQLNPSTSTISNATRRQTASIIETWNFGRPTCVCEFCGALHWYEERTEKSKHPQHPKFSTCCMEGRPLCLSNKWTDLPPTWFFMP
uniref:Uncharacterized protein LOC113787685 n=1 Tax=Cicer arietinum TaxID=3827 RepID=A0A3Q7XVM4_CICAR|nr:uncharacterized protein LOC113787685 [Cicer arietinum]